MKTKTIYRKHYGWGKFGHFAAAVVIVLVSGYAYAPATLAAVPIIFMQSATVKGASDKLTVTRVPVQDAVGKITYKDIIMAFDVDDQGKLSLRPGSFKITVSPILFVGQFKPGVYQGAVQDECISKTILYDVGSPGVLPGGRTAASINSRPADCTDEFSAAWVCGPIKGHPNEAALRAAGITSSSLCWGSVQITDSPNTARHAYPGWKSGDIIGAVQTGNSVSIHNFGDDNVENAALAFTLCPTCQ